MCPLSSASPPFTHSFNLSTKNYGRCCAEYGGLPFQKEFRDLDLMHVV
jgi:hypothetical protein